jgi:hypothetical protein
MPVDIHMEHKAMQGSIKTASHPVTAKISQVVDMVWASPDAQPGSAGEAPT